jgi:5-methylcytosine-specific restriction protein A
MRILFQAASPEHQKREKAKAKELRKSQWWRQQIGQGVCYHCKEHFKPEDLTMDHLTPIARGGKSTKKNSVPSCKECNSKKGYKMSVELTMEGMSEELKRLSESDPSEGDE